MVECSGCGWPNWLREHECGGGDVVSYEITMHRTELLPNGMIACWSDEFPDKQFLVVPADG